MREKSNPIKIAVIKIAAIGDVAMAARALSDFLMRCSHPIEIDWIIDHNLAPLARRLLSTQSIKFHSVDAKALFQGLVLSKALQASKIGFKLREIQPNGILILHRDRRYETVARLATQAPLVRIPQDLVHEVDAYTLALETLAKKMGIALNSPKTPALPPLKKTTPQSLPIIGVLIGGAGSAKLIYKEKRWPHLAQLISELLKSKKFVVRLFGGPEDKKTEQELLASLPDASRVESFVGSLNLDELPSALSELDTFISIDSGLAHIASNVMTSRNQKIVTLFGPTTSTRWAPKARGETQVHVLHKSLSCSPCYHDDGNFKPCQFTGEQFQKCMTTITVDEVLEVLNR